MNANKDLSKRVSKIERIFQENENIIENKKKEEERKKYEDIISAEVEKIKKMLYNSSDIKI